MSAPLKTKYIFVGNREMQEIDHGPKFLRLLKTVLSVTEFYKENLDQWQAHLDTAIAHVGKTLGSDQAPKFPTISYHLDRILNGAISNILLIEDNPTYCYVDMASINRANLELAINCVLLIRMNGFGFFASLLYDGGRVDKLMASELKQWSLSKNRAIAEPAKCQLKEFEDAGGRRETTLEKIVTSLGFPNPGKIPHIQKRARQAGEEWDFLYTSRYRTLCMWSHFHPQEVFFCPHNRKSEKEEMMGLSRGIEMLHFSFHLVYLLFNDVISKTGGQSDPLTTFYTQLMHKLKALLPSEGFHGPLGR